jgi:hypothetical protein
MTDPVSIDAATDELYSLDPDQFMDRRTELAAAAKAAGDGAIAKGVGALRKPTRSAYALNRLVREQPDAVDRIESLAEQLRAAQRELDGDRMRELSRERNRLVDELTRAAVKSAGASSAALRDEVSSTLSAAIADPDALDRLRSGALVRAETWSGFGGDAAPSLTLVRGDDTREVPTKAGKPAKAAPKAPGPSPADRAREQRKARLEQAEAELADAQRQAGTVEGELAERQQDVRRIEEQLKEAKRRLDDARLGARHAANRVERANADLKRLRR